jgi:hypothetical protein
MSCLKTETGALKCLIPMEFQVGPCGDSINTGCANPGMQCIKGFCGVPKGGQGDACGPGVACKAGLQCLKSPVSGAGSRCTVLQGLGGSCDQQSNFTTCQTGLNCNNGSSTCVSSVPVSLGGKCVRRVSECASGLTCVTEPGQTVDFLDWVGVCKLVSQLGGSCNPSNSQVCDRTENNWSVNLPQLECVNGKCANKTVGIWQDRCGPGTGATCAPRDAVAKLECDRKSCVHVNLTLGQPCQWPNRFGPESGRCAARFTCYGFDQPNAVTKCVRLALDGERCDYNNFTGCQNQNSSCVRGICTRA